MLLAFFALNEKPFYKTSDNAEKTIKENPDAVIVDVRTSKEYSEKHIKNAVNLSLYDIKEKASMVLPEKNRVILVYLRTGVRSRKASRMLAEMGYVNITDIDGIENYRGETE